MGVSVKRQLPYHKGWLANFEERVGNNLIILYKAPIQWYGTLVSRPLKKREGIIVRTILSEFVHK